MADTGEADLLDLAVRRLQAAVDQLEAAVGHSVERSRAAAAKARELEIFADDRVKLAEDLDAANARVASLATVNRDVSRRLDQTMESIRGVLGQDG